MRIYISNYLLFAKTEFSFFFNILVKTQIELVIFIIIGQRVCSEDWIDSYLYRVHFQGAAAFN